MIYAVEYIDRHASPHDIASIVANLQEKYPMCQLHWYEHPSDTGLGVMATNSLEPPEDTVTTNMWWHYSELWWRDEHGDAEKQQEWARSWRPIPSRTKRAIAGRDHTKGA